MIKDVRNNTKRHRQGRLFCIYNGYGSR